MKAVKPWRLSHSDPGKNPWLSFSDEQDVRFRVLRAVELLMDNDFHPFCVPPSEWRVQLFQCRTFCKELTLDELIECMKALLYYMENIIQAPTEQKYHRIGVFNEVFRWRIQKVPNAQNILHSVGFVLKEERYLHIEDVGENLPLLNLAVNALKQKIVQLYEKARAIPVIPVLGMKKRGGPAKAYKGSTRFRITHADTIGRRPSMEDQICIKGCFRGHIEEDFVGVFDGHGGKEAAQNAARLMPLELWKRTAIDLPSPKVLLRVSTPAESRGAASVSCLSPAKTADSGGANTSSSSSTTHGNKMPTTGQSDAETGNEGGDKHEPKKTTGALCVPSKSGTLKEGGLKGSTAGGAAERGEEEQAQQHSLKEEVSPPSLGVPISDRKRLFAELLWTGASILRSGFTNGSDNTNLGGKFQEADQEENHCSALSSSQLLSVCTTEVAKSPPVGAFPISSAQLEARRKQIEMQQLEQKYGPSPSPSPSPVFSSSFSKVQSAIFSCDSPSCPVLSQKQQSWEKDSLRAPAGSDTGQGGSHLLPPALPSARKRSSSAGSAPLLALAIRGKPRTKEKAKKQDQCETKEEENAGKKSNDEKNRRKGTRNSGEEQKETRKEIAPLVFAKVPVAKETKNSSTVQGEREKKNKLVTKLTLGHWGEEKEETQTHTTRTDLVKEITTWRPPGSTECTGERKNCSKRQRPRQSSERDPEEPLLSEEEAKQQRPPKHQEIKAVLQDTKDTTEWTKNNYQEEMCRLVRDAVVATHNRCARHEGVHK